MIRDASANNARWRSPRRNRFSKMPAFAQASRESARNSIPLSNGLGVFDVNVLYHSRRLIAP